MPAAVAKLKALLPGVSLREEAPDIHYLHIGKTAGSQIKILCRTIDELPDGGTFVMNSHKTRLLDIPHAAKYFFSIRNPVTRFKSGFYSRKRQGAPRKVYEWTAHEAAAYRDFEHANDLAEALSEDGELGSRAANAIQSIRHTAEHQSDWFSKCGYFLEVRPPLHIIRQEQFDFDFSNFLRKLNIAPDRLKMPEKPVHANSYDNVPELSSKAIANLSAWYEKDFSFYQSCDAWLTENQAG